MRFICSAQRHTSLTDMRGLLQDVLVQKNGMQFVNFAKFHDSLPNSLGDSMENRGIFYVPSLRRTRWRQPVLSLYVIEVLS